MPKFKFLEHTADVQFEAYGSDLKELFGNCALALSEVMADTKKIEPKKKISLGLKNKNREELLFDFLSQIIFYKDAEQLVFSKFKVEIKEKEGIYCLKADLVGEKINPEKHSLRDDAKAITWHHFQIEKNKEWKARVIVDV